jgi:Zn-dependent metalloprotease
MRNIPHSLCGVIPPHILTRVALQTHDVANADARATLEHMRELATGRTRTLIEISAAASPHEKRTRSGRHVYDGRRQFELPGQLVRSEDQPPTSDPDVDEAWEGSGATYDFFKRVFGRDSIDGRGTPLDATVHYGTRFDNAMWNGRQMIYGDGDGRVFTRFTSAVDVIAHELTHGVTEHAAALGYTGQTGALNEHISDAFGIMVKQYKLGLSASESDWLIGAGLFGPAVEGSAVRSLAFPGTAYDDPILGRDPQPSHMDDYVHTAADNGGVHINSGILNHAFYLAAMSLGGKTWKVLGRIWYAALTERLKPDAEFDDFTRATVDIAGELYGIGGRVQRTVAAAWADVGLPVTLHLCSPDAHDSALPRFRAARTVK